MKKEKSKNIEINKRKQDINKSIIEEYFDEVERNRMSLARNIM